MKFAGLAYLPVVLLVACTAAPTPTPTATTTPTITLTPTVAPTPTETPDPDRPPDATGKDSSSGEYTKTGELNGESVTYVWRPFQLGDDAASGIKGHWFESRMHNGPINLTGYGENCRDFWGDLDIYMSVYAVEGLRDLDMLGYLYHPDGPSDYITKDFTCTAPPNVILTDLFMQQHNLLPERSGGSSRNLEWNKILMAEYYPGGTPTDEQKERFAQDWQVMMRALNEDTVGQAENDLRQPQSGRDAGIWVGEELWQPLRGYEVYWITEDMAAADPSMHISLQSYTTKNFYWKVIVRNGTLTAIMAPAGWLRTQFNWPKQDSRERIFRWITLYPLQMVIDGEDVVNDNPGALAFQDYGSIMGPIPGFPNGGINTSWIAFTH